MRRLLVIAFVVLSSGMSLGGLTGCRSVRDDARQQFTQQLQDEGGLAPEVAKCVADRFFEERTTDELKEFFAREGLTDAERAEFQQLGNECITALNGS
jgi:hypothetical protein